MQGYSLGSGRGGGVRGWLLSSLAFVGAGDVADRSMEPEGVVVEPGSFELGDQLAGIADLLQVGLFGVQTLRCNFVNVVGVLMRKVVGELTSTY